MKRATKPNFAAQPLEYRIRSTVPSRDSNTNTPASITTSARMPSTFLYGMKCSTLPSSATVKTAASVITNHSSPKTPEELTSLRTANRICSNRISRCFSVLSINGGNSSIVPPRCNSVFSLCSSDIFFPLLFRFPRRRNLVGTIGTGMSRLPKIGF